MVIGKTRSAVASALCFAAMSASAAIVSTNNFETAYDGFSADVGEISSLVSLADYEQNGQPTGSKPAPFSDFGSSYLSLDTGDATVWRTFSTQSPNVYFDSYVKMAPCVGDIEYASDAKFVVFLNADTNLCVISGTAANDRTTVTNVLATASQIEADTWHRLTVRAETSDGVFAFGIFLDGTLLSSTVGGSDTFYSLTGDTTMTNVGLKGTGAIDDLVVRTTAPVFSGTVAATIDGEDFATLAEAGTEAAGGQTILLNTASSEDITLGAAGVVFDTNGKSYTGHVSAASGLGWTEVNGVYTASANTAATWTDAAGDHAWTNPGNWSSHGVPTAATTVTLPDGATIEATGQAALPVDSLVVNGAAKLTCTGDFGNNWPSIGIKGSVSGSGTLTLERFGLTSSEDDEVTVGCNIYFDGKTSDSFLQSGSFVLNGSVTGTNKFQLLADTTFNGAVTLPDGAILSVGRSGTAATATFGNGSSLSGTGTVALWSNGYDARNYTGFASIKTKLTDSQWTGVCELSGTMTYIDFSGFGHSGSTVRANGLSGYLNFSAGNTTKIATGIKALDIGSSGFTMNNKFSSGAACSYDFDAALTGSGTLTFGTQHTNDGTTKSFYTFNGDVSEFTGIVQFGSQSYRPIVVFKASGDVVPEPTDWGQIMVTSNKSVNVCAAWNSVGGYWIRGTANVSSTGSLVCGAGEQKIAGDGTIRYVAAPGSNPELSSSDWTGTVVLDYNPVATPFNPNPYGTPLSYVELATGRTVVGYLNDPITTKLRVNGSVTLNNGSSSTQRGFYTVSGTGTFIFQSNVGYYGETCNYTIDNLVDWNGTMTVDSSRASITNIVSGTGSVVFNVAPTPVPTIGSDYTGEIELGFNWQNVDLSAYSGDNATLVLGSMTGYFAQNNGGATGIKGKTVVDGTVVIENGWPKSAGNYWTDDRCVKFNTLKVTGSLALIYAQATGWQNLWGYVSAVALDGDSTGSITVGNNFLLKVNAVNFATAPSGTGRLVSLALTGANDSEGYSHKGKLYGPNGVAGEAIPVTVGGVATDQKLVYATVNDASGLYLAVAQYGSNYYATFQDALTARGSGSGDITVLDASAPIPEGYRIVDGKLVRKPAGAIINIF